MLLRPPWLIPPERMAAQVGGADAIGADSSHLQSHRGDRTPATQVMDPKTVATAAPHCCHRGYQVSVPRLCDLHLFFSFDTGVLERPGLDRSQPDGTPMLESGLGSGDISREKKTGGDDLVCSLAVE